MRITLYQQDITWLDTADNWQKIEQVLSVSAETDLLVVPEMCTSGFVTNPESEQVEESSDVEQRLLILSKKYNKAIVGSFAVRTDKQYNRCYFATPEGELHYYDKHHLFRPGMEHKGYIPGETAKVVCWHGIRFMLCVCYDLRFPAWLRYRENMEYDILICVANWPMQRQLAWNVLLRARAIENQVYCIGVNRVGKDDLCEYIGGSCAIHPYGHPVAECTDASEGLCTFEPDMEKLYSFGYVS